MRPNSQIALFHGKQFRKTLHNDEWWFVVNDVVAALTDTPDPKDYIRKMRQRDAKLEKGWGQAVTPLISRNGRGFAEAQLREPARKRLPMRKGKTPSEPD